MSKPTSIKNSSRISNRKSANKIVFYIIGAIAIVVLTIVGILYSNSQQMDPAIKAQWDAIKKYADTLPTKYGCADWNGNWLLSPQFPGGMVSPSNWNPGKDPCVVIDQIIVPTNLPTEEQLALFHKEYITIEVYDFMSRHFNDLKKEKASEVNVMGDGLAFLLLSDHEQEILGVTAEIKQGSNPAAWHWDRNSFPSCDNLLAINLLSIRRNILPEGLAGILADRGCKIP